MSSVVSTIGSIIGSSVRGNIRSNIGCRLHSILLPVRKSLEFKNLILVIRI